MGPVEQNEAIRFMRGLESAAFLNTVLIGWQDTPIDRAFYYTVTTTRWGLYDDRTPNKTYYGMQAFGELTRYGERVAAAGNLPEGSRTLAGRNAAGDLAILTACWKSGPLEIAFDIDGIERFGSIEVRMLDPTHDLEKGFFRRDGLGSAESPHRIRIERHPDRDEKIPARSGRKIGIVPEERPPRKRQLSEQARRFGGMGRAYSALRL